MQKKSVEILIIEILNFLHLKKPLNQQPVNLFLSQPPSPNDGQK